MKIQLQNPFNKKPLHISPGGLSEENAENVFPLRDGAYRIAGNKNYTENFGFQWKKFVTTQIDKTAKTDLTNKRFFAVTGWDKENLEGKNVLEVGSGAGRFTQIILDHTEATLYSVDFSEAVDANYKNNGPHNRLYLLQASIYEMPFAQGQFDKVFCFGVLQHTPDIEKSIISLIEMAKPGAEVIVDFYAINGWWTKLNAKYILRPVTKNMSNEKLHRLIDNNIDWLIKANRFFSAVGLGKIVNRFLPVCDIDGTLPPNLKKDQLREMCVLDTFDMFSPKYDQPQKVNTVVNLFKKHGMENIWGGPIKINNSKVILVKGIKRRDIPDILQ